MININLEYANLKEKLSDYQQQVTDLHEKLNAKSYLGSDYLGWLDWSKTYDKDEIKRVKSCAEKVKENCEVFLVCGIGGSYLGARSAIEMIKGNFRDSNIEIIYCGNTFSSTYMVSLLNHIKGKSVYLNVISKSGTTTETAVAFRILKQYMEETYKDEAKNRIIATTDKSKGTLKTLADVKGYETFVIPDDIGGRFSAITPVGLLPMAVAGIDIDEVIKGYCDAFNMYGSSEITENASYQYAVARHILDKQGYSSEMFVTYEPQLVMVAEWWKQLFGESEGKNGLGLLPTSVNYSTDLHSMGQFVQDGKKILFETLFTVEKPQLDKLFPEDAENADGMNYLAGKSLDFINKMACKGTLEAHYEEGGVPNLIINIEEISPYSYGLMIYFFFKAIAMSVYLNDTNPFDQPGVEVYKKRMFKLLGKE